MKLHRLARRRDAFSGWQKALVWEAAKHRRSSEDERARRRAAVTVRQQTLQSGLDRGAEGLANRLREALLLSGEDIAAPPLPRPLSAAEFREPPVDLEVEIGDTLANVVTVAEASTPLFWLICHVDWLEKGLLGGDIHAALFGGGGAAGKTDPVEKLEAETRNFLRRTGGIFVRGNVSVLSDCPISRAWWRRRLAMEAGRHLPTPADVDALHRLLHQSRPVWEELVMIGLKRFTVICHERVRAAVISRLSECSELEKADVVASARHLARHALGVSLAGLPWDELCRIAAGAGAEA